MAARFDFLLAQLARLPFFVGIWSKLQTGSASTRVDYGVFPYPNYAYGVFWAATLASRLGIPRISVIEFGVAGGRGLVALEQNSAAISAETGVGIDVFGFDTGGGMPAPIDYRDLPHIWDSGFYRMDVDKLRQRLDKAELVLGDVGTTAARWIEEPHAPIGFIAFDLDYYSSTVAAFQILGGASSSYLPRVHCYFDDVTSNDLGCMNPYVGELLAIREFNDKWPDRKICRIEQLRVHRRRWEKWQERMFAFHDFSHPLYTKLVVPRDEEARQIPL